MGDVRPTRWAGSGPGFGDHRRRGGGPQGHIVGADAPLPGGRVHVAEPSATWRAVGTCTHALVDSALAIRLPGVVTASRSTILARHRGRLVHADGAIGRCLSLMMALALTPIQIKPRSTVVSACRIYPKLGRHESRVRSGQTAAGRDALGQDNNAQVPVDDHCRYLLRCCASGELSQ